MTRKNNGASIKWALFSVLLLIGIVSIPVGVAQANDFLIGASSPTAEADNLVHGTYYWENSTGSQMQSSVSYIVDNGQLSIHIPDENLASDSGPDKLEIRVDQPTARTLIDSEIVEYYAEMSTTENYENIDFSVSFSDGTNSFQIHSEEDLSGNKFSNLEDITTDYAYTIQSETSENASPLITIGTQANDNELLTNAVIDAKSWAYESDSVVHAEHEIVWQISMVSMGVISFVLALFATNRFDLEVNF